MKKFEVGKKYESRNGAGTGYDERIWVETWECTKIKNNKVTLNLVGYAISDYGSDKLKKVKNFKPRKVLCTIHNAGEGFIRNTEDFEIANNYAQKVHIWAINEI